MPNQLHSHPRKFGKDSRACRVCNTTHGLVRKYQLMVCRRCFREQANLIGFHKYRWGTSKHTCTDDAVGTTACRTRGDAWNSTPCGTCLPLQPTLYTELNFLMPWIQTLKGLGAWVPVLKSIDISLVLRLLYSSHFSLFQLFKRNYSIFYIYLIGYDKLITNFKSSLLSIHEIYTIEVAIDWKLLLLSHSLKFEEHLQSVSRWYVFRFEWFHYADVLFVAYRFNFVTKFYPFILFLHLPQIRRDRIKTASIQALQFYAWMLYSGKIYTCIVVVIIDL